MILMITVAVMIILASTTIVSYNNIVEDTLKRDFASEIYSVQKLVEQYHFINNEYPINEEYILDMDNIDSKYMYEFEKETIEDGNIVFYVIDLNKCDVQEIKRGKNKISGDVYVVSNKTGIVYYIDGVVIDDMKYYTLTDDLRNEIGL